MKKVLLSLFLAASLGSLAQDSLRVMFHNLLNFPSTGASRTDDYRVMLQYAKPDVYVVNELDTEAGADSILSNSLNVYGTSTYQRAVFYDGVDTDNCLFYNSDKLGLVSQLQLQTVLRDISVYRMYYKAPNLTAQTDTIYLWFFSCHLKAGSTDFEQRNLEAQQVKFFLNDQEDVVENIFVGGDFNFYSGFESGCLTLLNSGAIPLVDPVNAIGNWSQDFAYADWHTQSTRTSSFGSGAGGGLDDRFDLIFVSEDVMNNANGVNYLAGTYEPLGQDGNHFNDAVNFGTNNSAPDSVIQALYWGSDHLPIMMDIVFDETASSKENELDYLQTYYDPIEHALKFTTSYQNMNVALFDLSGRLVFSATNVSDKIDLPIGLNGVFVWSILADGKQLSDKIIIP